MSVLLEGSVQEPRIAYFSMEIALCSDIPTCSGGLVDCGRHDAGSGNPAGWP
jgi:hypothetical protein